MKRARIVAAMVACVVALAPFGAAPADPPGPNAASTCTRPFFATFEQEAKAVVVRVIDLEGPFTGTITAYGAGTMWTATIERTALVELPYGGSESSITVRADGPIEGIAYRPAWASCSFRAGTRSRRDYEAPERDRPVLTVGNQQPIAPATCARPYSAASIKRVVEPNTPVQAAGVAGTVMVAVALDERGVARFARVISSPSAELNASATYAAKQSEYTTAVFRCEPVPSSYQFNVGYI